MAVVSAGLHRCDAGSVPPGAEFQVSPPYATFTFPFRHPEHPGARYADLVLFALTMVALAAHAFTHRAAPSRRLGLVRVRVRLGLG